MTRFLLGCLVGDNAWYKNPTPKHKSIQVSMIPKDDF